MAARRGLDAAWIEKHLALARLQPAVQRFIMPPPAGTAKNWAAYRDRFAATAKAGLLDDEYSLLNYHTAHILRRKIRILRSAILCFLIGVLLAIPHHLMQS